MRLEAEREVDGCEMARLRLISQQVAEHRFKRPGEVVSWLGAVQAQDFAGAKWSISLRLAACDEAAIDQCIADREIVRTWPMRGTLHFVSGGDVHWMLALLASRMKKELQRRDEHVLLTAADYDRALAVVVGSLTGNVQLSRVNLLSLLEDIGVRDMKNKTYHIISRLAHDGVICFGNQQDSQPTFALLSEWCPQSHVLSREESLSLLAKKYFTSHGPATAADLARWSGLPLGDVRQGISLCSDSLASVKHDGQTYWMSVDLPDRIAERGQAFLLPGFDEYMLGYKDRSMSLAPEYAQAICPGANGIFIPTVVIDGQVVGTWSKKISKSAVTIKVSAFAPLSRAQKEATQLASEPYGRYLQMPIVVAF